MAQRFTKYTPLPDQPYDPRVTDLERPLRVPGTGVGLPGSSINGYPIGGTISGGQATTSAGGSLNAADVAAASPVVVVDNYKNRNLANTTPIQLVANVQTRALPANLRRTGLLIQNKDTTAALFFAFGNQADANSVSLAALGFALFDFTTPRDDLWLFATANIQVALMEMSRAPS